MPYYQGECEVAGYSETALNDPLWLFGDARWLQVGRPHLLQGRTRGNQGTALCGQIETFNG